MQAATIKLGVIGLGRAFSLMLPTFLQDPRITLVAACDPRASARHQFAADFGTTAYASVEALVQDARVQAVYVASPHQFHCTHTALAAAHGKHVLVEKPMALDLASCDQMIAACRSARVHLIAGHCHSFDTPYLKTKELINSGTFGRVRMMHALNFTDYLYRPRRAEELDTAQGGGAVFSQAAHQIDIVRLLAQDRPSTLRSALGRWDPQRPTEGAYSALLFFAHGAYASLNYSGYGHFDSDEWMGWVGEMGAPKHPDHYSSARRNLAQLSVTAEADIKAASGYGGPRWQRPAFKPTGAVQHQHFGPIIVSCDAADLRPLPNGIMVYAHDAKHCIPLDTPKVPRAEVIDALYDAVYHDRPALHDGLWARATVEICLAMLTSAHTGAEVVLHHQSLNQEGPGV